MKVRFVSAVFACGTACASSHALAEQAAEQFISYESGAQATLVVEPTDVEDMYLLFYEGFGHDFDDKAFLYKKEPVNHANLNDGFVYKMAGANDVNFRQEGKRTLISGTETMYEEILLEGLPTIRMVYKDEPSPLQREAILRQYDAQQGLTESRVKARKAVENSVEEFRQACHPDLEVQIDWDSFVAKGEKTTPAMAARYIESLQSICLIDDDFKAAVADITEIAITPSEESGTHDAQLDGQVLSLQLSRDTPNVSRTGYSLIYSVIN